MSAIDSSASKKGPSAGGTGSGTGTGTGTGGGTGMGTGRGTGNGDISSLANRMAGVVARFRRQYYFTRTLLVVLLTAGILRLLLPLFSSSSSADVARESLTAAGYHLGRIITNPRGNEVVMCAVKSVPLRNGGLADTTVFFYSDDSGHTWQANRVPVSMEYVNIDPQSRRAILSYGGDTTASLLYFNDYRNPEYTTLKPIENPGGMAIVNPCGIWPHDSAYTLVQNLYTGNMKLYRGPLTGGPWQRIDSFRYDVAYSYTYRLAVQVYYRGTFQPLAPDTGRGFLRRVYVNADDILHANTDSFENLYRPTVRMAQVMPVAKDKALMLIDYSLGGNSMNRNKTMALVMKLDKDGYHPQKKFTILSTASAETADMLIHNKGAVTTFMRSADSGSTYLNVSADTLRSIKTFAFPGAQYYYMRAAAADSTARNIFIGAESSSGIFVWHSTNGGGTWAAAPVVISRVHMRERLTYKYLLWMMYGCVLALLFSVTLMRAAGKNVISEREKTIINSETLFADNPESNDTLGFKKTADAVVNVLTDPATTPPVSIVISGQWGSGKSSLMRMVQDELTQRYGFRSSWFNIWHFQEESQLLTALLSSLLEQFRGSNELMFRLRLLYYRFRRFNAFDKYKAWFAAALLLPLLIYIITHLHFFRPLVFPGFNGLVDRAVSNFLILISNPKDIKDKVYIGASAFMWLLGTFFLSKTWLPEGLSAFTDLIPVKKFKMEIANNEPGLRMKYKKEFWEIQSAYGNSHPIVIFIDDIDRIAGDKVKEMLEAINFITDTASRPDNLRGEARANIFFIMGMYTAEVIHNLGTALTEKEGRDDADARGADYIAKMVDLVVPVPYIDDISESEKDSLIMRP